MNSHSNLSSSRSRLVFAVSAATLTLFCLVALAVSSGAPADAAKRPGTAVLGGADPMPDPLCPLNCQVIPSVSGIQNFLPSGNSPYRASANGKVTAWKLWLGKPTASDRTLLNEAFGSPPQAAITVVQAVKTKKGTQFRLQRKSPVVGLNKYLGKTASFRLDKPLYIKKGQFVTLSVPTWAPAFAAGLPGSQYGWRASRQPRKCAGKYASQSSPQLKVGSKRSYGCNFKGSRLLFTAKVKFD